MRLLEAFDSVIPPLRETYHQFLVQLHYTVVIKSVIYILVERARRLRRLFTALKYVFYALVIFSCRFRSVVVDEARTFLALLMLTNKRPFINPGVADSGSPSTQNLSVAKKQNISRTDYISENFG